MNLYGFLLKIINDLGIVLVLVYTIIFGTILIRLKWIEKIKLNRLFILGIFLLKIGVGISYGWLHQYLYGKSDTWSYFEGSRLIHETFYENPVHFFQLTLWPNAEIPPAHLQEIASAVNVWSDTAAYTILRINAWIHFFSFGYYGVHVVFWCFLSLIGLLAIYHIFSSTYPDRKKALIGPVFLAPSIVFWESGLHKGGLCIFCFGVILTGFQQVIHNQTRVIHIIMLITMTFLLILVRLYAFLLLAPGLIAYAWTYYYPKNSFSKFGFCYMSALFAALVIGYLFPSLSILAQIVKIQQVFVLGFVGQSDIYLPLLEPNIWSFIQLAPRALMHVLFRPSFGDIHHFFALLSACETYFYLLLLALALVFNRLRSLEHRALIYLSLYFSFFFFLLVGLTIDNIGAFIRYRTLAYPFFLSALVVLLDDRVFKFLGFKK